MKNPRATWVKTVNETIQQNKAFQHAVMNNPNVRRSVANFLQLLQRQVDKGEISQQQALDIFKVTAKQLSKSMQVEINKLQPQAPQPRQDDLSNTVNMTMALQTVGSLANTQMADAAEAMQQTVNDTMATVEQATIQEATAEIEAENEEIANTQQQETNQPESQLTEGVKLAAACDLAKDAIEGVFGKGIEEAEKFLTKTFEAIGDKMGFETNDIKNLEEDLSGKFQNPFKTDLKPKPPE